MYPVSNICILSNILYMYPFLYPVSGSYPISCIQYRISSIVSFEANLPACCRGGGGAVEGEAGVSESQRWAILQPGQQGQGTGSTCFVMSLKTWKMDMCTECFKSVFIRSQLLGSLILFWPARFFRFPISSERSNNCKSCLPYVVTITNHR